MTSFALFDRGCEDTHRTDGVPVGPARGKAGNFGDLRGLASDWLPARGFPLWPGATFAPSNRPEIRLQSDPHAPMYSQPRHSGPFRRRAMEADGPDGPVDSLRSCPPRQRTPKTPRK